MLEVYYEIDGIYCSRCNERLCWVVATPDDFHDCIQCYECGEHDACICDEPHERRIERIQLNSPKLWNYQQIQLDPSKR